LITTTSGYDHVDLTAALQLGIPVMRCPMARRDAVVEHTLGGILWWLRRFADLDHAANEGRWARGQLPSLAPPALSGLVVAVVGLGVIGRRVARVLEVFGARVVAVDPHGAPDGLERVALSDAVEEARVVTLHCRLEPSTRGLLSEIVMDRMRPDALIVNTARGDCLDVRAAVERVRADRLGGLVADVFPVEPYPTLASDSATPRVLLTPHSAGYSTSLAGNVVREVVDALRAWVSGDELPHRVV